MEDRKICTKEKPMPKLADGKWLHEDAEEIHSSDYYIQYTCPNCGKVFNVEMPD